MTDRTDQVSPNDASALEIAYAAHDAEVQRFNGEHNFRGDEDERQLLGIAAACRAYAAALSGAVSPPTPTDDGRVPVFDELSGEQINSVASRAVSPEPTCTCDDSGCGPCLKHAKDADLFAVSPEEPTEPRPK